MSDKKAPKTLRDQDFQSTAWGRQYVGKTLLEGIDAAAIRPLFDRVIVRDIPDEDRVGSIFLPEAHINNRAGLRMGVVVAVGDGDKWVEAGLDNYGNPKRKGLKGIDRLSMSVKVGDKVLYDRRREAEIYIDGQRLSIVNESQSIVGVLED